MPIHSLDDIHRAVLIAEEFLCYQTLLSWSQPCIRIIFEKKAMMWYRTVADFFYFMITARDYRLRAVRGEWAWPGFCVNGLALTIFIQVNYHE
jgi:hypothetical protein